MNSTAAVLRKVRYMCASNVTCKTCPLFTINDCIFTVAEYWSDEEIENMADAIDDYEEEEE